MSYIQKKLELAKICDDLIEDFERLAASTKAFKESVNYSSNDRNEFDNIDDDSQMPLFLDEQDGEYQKVAGTL